MSIELQEARRKLDVLEDLTKHPERMLIDLYGKDGVDGENFLLQVRVDGKHFYDYVTEYLRSLSQADGCEISVRMPHIYFYMPGLNNRDEYVINTFGNCMFKINIKNNTYEFCNDTINDYEDIMDGVYVGNYVPRELPDFFKRLGNFTIRDRFRVAMHEFVRIKNVFRAIYSACGILLIPRKVVLNKIEQAKEDIRYRNERDEEYRNKEIERQNWFKEHAPAYIESVKQKQQELAEYFISLGYTKESNC